MKQQQKKDQDTSTEDQGDVFVPLGSFVDLGIQNETITIEGSKDMEETFFSLVKSEGMSELDTFRGKVDMNAIRKVMEVSICFKLLLNSNGDG